MKTLTLRSEPYISQYKPDKIVKSRLILRDECGRIRVVTRDTTRTPYPEEQLLVKARRIKLNPERCKSIERRGFKYSVILAGIRRNPVTGQREFRRYQIFKATPYIRADKAVLHRLFRSFVPKELIGFYIWHDGKFYVERESPK